MSIVNVHHDLAMARAEIARLRAEVANEKRRADEAEDEIARARELIDARGIARGLGGHYVLRSIIAQQLHRAEAAEAEHARLSIAAASARYSALAEAQAIAERCARERKASMSSCVSAGVRVESLVGKASEARRIADEIAALRGKA